ncbi:MAG: hypothetical protein FJ189_05640 [Gammaproteobacteria bacterium]|nr:hypothetical protein [Gammaproteobacteria bacterium]
MSPKQLAQLAYLLQLAAIVTGITYPVSALISHTQRAKASGTLLESHFRWQIQTFWISLAVGLAGVMALAAGPLGLMILSGDLMWIVYRVVQGWVRLSRDEPIGP